MLRHLSKTPGLGHRRSIRRQAADLPDVPVVTPASIVSGDATPVSEQTQSVAAPDPVDERIRRMIEAAYT